MGRNTARLLLFLLACAQGARAQEAYTAETTWRKLAPAYPFIRIAGSDTPAGVTVLRDLNYAPALGLALDLYLPGRRAPAVVLVHGGGWRSGDRREFSALAVRLAARGYAAVAVSYRLSGQAQYPAAIHDVKAAVRWVRANAARFDIDGTRIAIAGASAGGQIASLVGTTNGMASFDPGATAVSSAVQAIVNIDGLSDLTSGEARKYEDRAGALSSAGAWFGGGYAEKTALWHEASPIFYVDAATPPVLFIGSAQPRFSAGREAMVEKLKSVGVVGEVVMLPDTPHAFWMFDPWLQPTVDTVVQFLDRTMPPSP
jgi:acetyl esterase/lipase